MLYVCDEVYVIVVGMLCFVVDGCECDVVVGDVLFVFVYVEYCFVGFFDDFLIWVFFYGFEGGECGV